MTYVATTGAHSCACISIARWDDASRAAEREYLSKETTTMWGEGLSLVEWYSNVLYPTDQELGKTYDYAFSHLMDMIDSDERLEGKYITAVLAEYQYESGFWPERLRARGFKLVDKTNNYIGGINYIYVRNNARVEIEDDEE